MRQAMQAMAEHGDILARARRRLLDAAAVAVVCAAIPGIAALVWRNRELGWGPLASAQVAVTVVMLGLALACRRLPLRLGIVIFLSCSHVIATFGLLRLGLAAAAKPLLLLNCVLAMALLGPRASLLWAGLGALSMTVVGVLTCGGHLAPSPNLALHLLQPVAWLNDLINFVAFAAIGIACMAVIYGALSSAVSDLNQRADELQRANSRLRAANAELERFTFAVSHDLKSPLITISGFIGRLRSDLAAGRSDRLDLTFERIEGAAQHMKVLLDELLDLSRVGRQTNPPQAVALGDLVAEALELLGARVQECGIRVDITPDLPLVMVDRNRALQVVTNLLDNVIKFARHDVEPRVTIGWSGCDMRSRWPVFEVRDNGVGFDPAYAERVFGLFDQLDPSRPGAGVGLALVQRIIETHGGRVWAESSGPGAGARISFALPPAENAGLGEVP